MRPILNLAAPTGDVKAIKNIDTILSIIDTIKEAKLMYRITLNMLNVIESKAVARERMHSSGRRLRWLLQKRIRIELVKPEEN